MARNETYGWLDDASDVPAYDPPHDAPCLYCGDRLRSDDVRTHSVVRNEIGLGDRCYFYRTHRTCDEVAGNEGSVALMRSVLDRISHDLDGEAP